jgi:hypothetical protein
VFCQAYTSPVPRYITLVSWGAMARQLADRTGWPVTTRFHAFTPMPPVRLTQSPPEADPAYTVLGRNGLSVTQSVRPPMLSGPSDRHFGPDRWLAGARPSRAVPGAAAGGAASTALIASAWRTPRE